MINMNLAHPIIQQRSEHDYTLTWQAMRDFVDMRDSNTTDEIWLVEHNPVYTLGQNGKTEHILNAANIPVVQSDRGGQVTYHGPGQLVIYFLLDLRRLNLGVRQLVTHIENSVIQLLASYAINACANPDAPGVYVNGAKICSLGLRIRRGYSYHGLSLNVAMDLEPFSRINPCGYSNLPITQLKDLGGPSELGHVAPPLIDRLLENLGYTKS